MSEPMPMPGGPDWGEAYGAWARRVQVDLAALKVYAEAVYAATDTYLASLSDADLESPVHLVNLKGELVRGVMPRYGQK